MGEQPKTRGHKKRAKTRAQIIDAGIVAFVEHGEGLTAQSVTERAGVAHGTLYNHFKDLNALVDAVVVSVVGRIAEAIATEGPKDPALRLAVATLRILHVLNEQPLWARAVLRINAKPDYDIRTVTQHLRFDIAEGVAMGRFVQPDDDVSFELVLGLMLMNVRRIARGEWDLTFGETAAARLLLYFGLDVDEANMLAASAANLVYMPPANDGP